MKSNLSFHNKNHFVFLFFLLQYPAFTAIVTSCVNDIITPIIGLAAQNQLSNVLVVLRKPSNSTNVQISSPEQAKQLGFVTLNYGSVCRL